MNRFWLKIAGLVVAVVMITTGGYVLWHAKTPHTGQTPKQRTSKSATQPKRQLAPEDFQSGAVSKLEDRNPREQQLRQKAALLSTLYRDPNSPEAAKARELLLKVPKGVEEQYGAVQRKRNLPLLNIRHDQNDIELPKPSQQPSDQSDDSATQMQSQQFSNAQPENIKELSDKLLEEHLAQYKVTRNEMFPIYLDSTQSGIPADVLYRLPAPYIRQLETSSFDARAGLLSAGSQQDGVKQPNTIAGASMSTRSLQRFVPPGTGQSNTAGSKIGAESFKKFDPEGAKKQLPTAPKNIPNQPTSQTKK